MTLREQIRKIAERRVNPVYAEATNFPMLVTMLSAKAFIEQWPDGDDTAALRHAAKLLESPGFVSEHMLAVRAGD